MAQIAHDLVHESWIVPEWVRNILQVLLGLVVPADTHTVVADQEVEFKHELKNLIYRDLESIVPRSSQETFL